MIVSNCQVPSPAPEATPELLETPSRSPEFQEAIDRGEILVGMTQDDVEDAWGETECAFEDTFEGSKAEAWGYGPDPVTKEMTGVSDCQNATLVVYFVDGKVAGWAAKG